MEKEKHGGPRKGSGRPKSEPTKILTFRVKLDHEQPVRDAVKKVVSALNKKTNKHERSDKFTYLKV